MSEPVAWRVASTRGHGWLLFREIETARHYSADPEPLYTQLDINEAADKALLNATKYSDFVQAVTDPENQPSQYGTVTLDYHRAAIAELESKLAESEKLAAAISRDCNDTALERNAAKAATADLVAAGRAVVERWDSPLWKDQPHTGEYISRLRATCDKHDTKKVAP